MLSTMILKVDQVNLRMLGDTLGRLSSKRCSKIWWLFSRQTHGILMQGTFLVHCSVWGQRCNLRHDINTSKVYHPMQAPKWLVIWHNLLQSQQSRPVQMRSIEATERLLASEMYDCQNSLQGNLCHSIWYPVRTWFGLWPRTTMPLPSFASRNFDPRMKVESLIDQGIIIKKTGWTYLAHSLS
jgi:hypothetical protein